MENKKENLFIMYVMRNVKKDHKFNEVKGLIYKRVEKKMIFIIILLLIVFLLLFIVMIISYLSSFPFSFFSSSSFVANESFNSSKPAFHNFILKNTSPETNFCGVSSHDPCKTSADCVAAGCSSQYCVNREHALHLYTTCEFKPCYDSQLYNMVCSCVNNECQWIKRM